ncbi:unnamed protein product [marine sediment metagenome]|uniref:Uncharacterized protein n=1 Tax=marine sediment metagenome TaxID=412755 RepID=X0UN73_9ZZZZ
METKSGTKCCPSGPYTSSIHFVPTLRRLPLVDPLSSRGGQESILCLKALNLPTDSAEDPILES